MQDHLGNLLLRLSNEKVRLQTAKTEGERELRGVWVAQLEKEVANEVEFLATADISDDELLKELLA